MPEIIKYRDSLAGLSKDDLIDYCEILLRNFWTLQGNWVVEIQKKFGADLAMETDGIVFGKFLEVEAHRLKKFLNLGDDMAALAKLLGYSFGFANTEFYFPELSDNKLMLRVTKCNMQLQRLARGDTEVLCKKAGETAGSISKGAKVINPRIEARCLMAPPDKHPDDVWCEWEFNLI